MIGQQGEPPANGMMMIDRLLIAGKKLQLNQKEFNDNFYMSHVVLHAYTLR
jgi:hypothetical protein